MPEDEAHGILPYEKFYCPLCLEECADGDTWCAQKRFAPAEDRVPITPMRVRWTPQIVSDDEVDSAVQGSTASAIGHGLL